MKIINKTIIASAVAIIIAGGFFKTLGKNNDITEVTTKANTSTTSKLKDNVEQDNIVISKETATLAGGCFWCTEADMEKFLKDTDVISGFSGGDIKEPTYRQVASGETRHIESIEFDYDPEKHSYTDILDNFIKYIDPTDKNGSFYDRGYQYSPAIFYHNENQKLEAEQFVKAIQESKLYKKELKIKILDYKFFVPAETYHQDYYKKSPVKYSLYRLGSGRDSYVDSIFKDNKKTIKEVINYKIDDIIIKRTKKVHPVVNNNEVKVSKQVEKKVYIKPSELEIKKMLTPIQYKVTQHEGTERPFNNEYWDNKEEGLYVDIVSGEPLFSSKDKYKSGTGWPSFSKPIDKSFIVEKEDKSLFSIRTEVRSKFADSHLGHVFNDGPQSTGLRYCMNSASMKFIPKEKLAENGYHKYIELFN